MWFPVAVKVFPVNMSINRCHIYKRDLRLLVRFLVCLN